MSTLAHFISFLMLGWLAALAAIVIGKAFFGTGRYQGFLESVQSRDGETSVDPERVQLLAVFLGATALYVLEAIRTVANGPAISLPEASEALTIALAGSNALYLSGKLVRS